jgi:hypothetical protein
VVLRLLLVLLLLVVVVVVVVRLLAVVVVGACLLRAGWLAASRDVGRDAAHDPAERPEDAGHHGRPLRLVRAISARPASLPALLPLPASLARRSTSLDDR